MKLLARTTALFWCLVAVGARSDLTYKPVLPSVFEPPQVFQNANLVHIISLEKNYAKENINVQIENVDKYPQNEYYVPFNADLISRVGGFEVKDRKNQDIGNFEVDMIDVSSESDVQYFRIKLPAPLDPGAQQTLGISFFVLKAYSPLPAAIQQTDKQYLVYSFNTYAPSAYPTIKQKTEVKTSSVAENYTIINNENPTKSGSKLTYGPFLNVAAGSIQPAKVRFEFTKPVLHVTDLERDVEVSHWGGNIAFEERYALFHRGANLSSHFDRVKWAQSAYYSPTTYALKELKFPLQPSSADPYYIDVIGNVSTSRFRSSKREAMLETKPRYPVFGGWKYPFTIGWNADSGNLLRKSVGDGYVLRIPFLEGPKQSEGIEYENVRVRIVLPEGAT